MPDYHIINYVTGRNCKIFGLNKISLQTRGRHMFTSRRLLADDDEIHFIIIVLFSHFYIRNNIKVN